MIEEETLSESEYAAEVKKKEDEVGSLSEEEIIIEEVKTPTVQSEFRIVLSNLGMLKKQKRISKAFKTFKCRNLCKNRARYCRCRTPCHIPPSPSPNSD